MKDYYNLDLENMTPEEIESSQRTFLVEELGKKLINSNERVGKNIKISKGKYLQGHRYLAMKYWPEEFTDDTRKEVHHINFDHFDNVTSNLVVLTPFEHRTVHNLFDVHRKEGYKKAAASNTGKTRTKETRKKMSDAAKNRAPMSEETKEKISKANSNKKQSQETIEKRREKLIGKSHPCKDETKTKISITLQGHEPWNKNKKCPNISEGMKGVYVGWHWYKDSNTGKRVWWRENPETHEIEYKG